MRTAIQQLLFQIARSEKAYKLYLEKKYFYQALRIFEADKQIYEILIQNGELRNNSIQDIIIQFIFHLEDWFQQFEQLRNISQPLLEDTFVFTRLKDSIPFPGNIIEQLKMINE